MNTYARATDNEEIKQLLIREPDSDKKRLLVIIQKLDERITRHADDMRQTSEQIATTADAVKALKDSIEPKLDEHDKIVLTTKVSTWWVMSISSVVGSLLLALSIYSYNVVADLRDITKSNSDILKNLTPKNIEKLISLQDEVETLDAKLDRLENSNDAMKKTLATLTRKTSIIK